MAQFQFALTRNDMLRTAGAIEADTLNEAMFAIEWSTAVDNGDILRIGVSGFPPAQFNCLGARIVDGQIVPAWSARRSVPRTLAA